MIEDITNLLNGGGESPPIHSPNSPEQKKLLYDDFNCAVSELLLADYCKRQEDPEKAKTEFFDKWESDVIENIKNESNDIKDLVGESLFQTLLTVFGIETLEEFFDILSDQAKEVRKELSENIDVTT